MLPIVSTPMEDKEACACHFRALIESGGDAMLAESPDGLVTCWNAGAERMFGYPAADMIGRSIDMLFPLECREEAWLSRERARHGVDRYETCCLGQDGGRMDIQCVVSPILGEQGRVEGFSRMLRDITESRFAKSRIRKLDQLYAALSRCHDAVMRCADEAELFDAVCSAIVAQGEVRFVRVDLLEREGEIRQVARAGSEEENLEALALPIRRNGHPVGSLTFCMAGAFDEEVRDLFERIAEVVNFALDNFARKAAHDRAAEALRESEERFRILADQSLVGIYTLEAGTISYLNAHAAEMFGYKPEELLGRSPEVVVAEEDREMVRNNILLRQSGRERMIRYEFRGRRKDGSTNVVSAHTNLVEIQGRLIPTGVIQDVTERLHSEEVIREYVARIERTILGTVDAISGLVELRDPYTAGHEHRVGHVAAAIAAEMGFDEKFRMGLQVAGAVHDVGKIAIPTEILTMPRRLTALEFELVKDHAEQGFEILSRIDSPWPIAEVARQHHERMDGSGYPRGLAGGEILLEARIIAVADVVESMTSSRPYRAGLGIEKALAELEMNTGRYYDAQVVHACLHLFREKGYVIPS